MGFRRAAGTMDGVCRRTLNFVLVLSLAFCLALVAVWVWSYRRGEFVELNIERRSWNAGIDSGRLLLELRTPSWEEPGTKFDGPAIAIYARSAERREWFPGTAGFAYDDEHGAGYRSRTVTIPI